MLHTKPLRNLQRRSWNIRNQPGHKKPGDGGKWEGRCASCNGVAKLNVEGRDFWVSCTRCSLTAPAQSSKTTAWDAWDAFLGVPRKASSFPKK